MIEKYKYPSMSDEYITSHFEEIKSHGSDINDFYCTVEQLKQDNHRIINGYRSYREKITFITENYENSFRSVLDWQIQAFNA